MNKKRILGLLSIVFLVVTGLSFAGTKEKSPSRGGVSRSPVPFSQLAARAATDERQLMFYVEVEASYLGMETGAKFLTLNASQANYVKSDGKKKISFIANVLAVSNPNDPEQVDIQVQIEVSRLGVPQQTFQMQTEVVTRLGKKIVLSDSEDVRVVLKLTEYRQE